MPSRDWKTLGDFLDAHPRLLDDFGCATRFKRLLKDIHTPDVPFPLISYADMRKELDRAYRQQLSQRADRRD